MTNKKIFNNETIQLPLTIESHGIVYKDNFKKIEKVVAIFDNFKKEYYVSDFGEKVAVLVVNDNRILLTRQYRLFINGLSYEVPGGSVEKGEDLKDAAIRECYEETGFNCKDLRLLISYDPDLEYTRNHTTVFYTDNFGNTEGILDDTYVWLPLNKCMDMINLGKISDSLTIISILSYTVQNIIT